MKLILVLAILCLSLVGCGTKDEYVTRSEIREIVEETISESDADVIDEEGDGARIYSVATGIDPRVEDVVSPELIDSIANYNSVDMVLINEEDNDYEYTVKCTNKTDKTIESISVKFETEFSNAPVDAYDVQPGEEMSFVFPINGNGELIYAYIESVTFEE